MINPTERDAGREVVLDYESTSNADNPLKTQVPGWRGVYIGPALITDDVNLSARVHTNSGIFNMRPEQLQWATVAGHIKPAEEYRCGSRAMRLRGAAALTEMLAVLGDDRYDDHTVARLLVDNELELRALLRYALRKVAR